MRRVRRIAVTPTVSLTAYTAADSVGGLMTFAITDQGFDGLLRSVLLTDNAAQSEQYVLYIYESLPSTIANDAEYLPTLADLKKLVTSVVVATGDWTEINSKDWALLGGHEDAAMEIPIHSDNGSIYLYAVATDTPDYVAATDLTITLTVEVF